MIPRSPADIKELVLMDWKFAARFRRPNEVKWRWTRLHEDLGQPPRFHLMCQCQEKPVPKFVPDSPLVQVFSDVLDCLMPIGDVPRWEPPKIEEIQFKFVIVESHIWRWDHERYVIWLGQCDECGIIHCAADWDMTTAY